MTVQKYIKKASDLPPHRGRGVTARPDSRYSAWQRSAHAVDDAVENDAEPQAPPVTQLFVDQARRVISYNQSPDVPFDRSINPYRGCEHGCSYCFARPSHAYLDLSPGLDFETHIGWKPHAAARLREELAHPGYRCAPIALGVNTDAYQPLERQLGLTRALLQVLAETRHPVSLITKSALIERDIDLLTELARQHLVEVLFSVTTLDPLLARRMEPRAARPARRLTAMRRLADAGIPVGVLFAPIIPALNDHEMEAVLSAAANAGARHAGYVVLRLPHELKTLFADWLGQHYPDRAKHVLARLAELRDGQLNDARFGHRMRGQGVYAALYRQRLWQTCRRLGLNESRLVLDTTRFQPPARHGQMALF